jgi:flagellar biosynthesis/type III secretory pathway protein FliH
VDGTDEAGTAAGAGGRTSGGPPGAVGRPAPAREAGPRIAADVFEARLRARALLERAEVDAEEIRAAARSEVAEWRRRACEEGRQEGLARAASEVARGAAERDRLLAACEGELVDAAVALAARVLGREVRPGEDAVRAARAAIADLRGTPRVTLRASRVDLPALLQAVGAPRRQAERLRILEDPELDPGEVVLEAGGARVDGRFGARLAELRRALPELLA